MADREPLLKRDETVESATGSVTRGSSNLERVEDVAPEPQDLRTAALLNAQGHKAEMERSFSLMAALGLGFSITNSWVGYLCCFGQNLAYAGPNSVIFGLLTAVAVQWMISLGLYEIASCFPSSGGQYHFVFILAPKKYKKFAAFSVGWMNILGWSVALCSGVSVVVASVSGLIAFWNPAFHVTQLQSYLLYVGVTVLSACPLFIGPRAIPCILQASLALSVIGFCVIFCLIISLRKQAQPLAFVFNTRGTTGWGVSTAWLLGIGNSMYAFTSTDAAIHIAEEMVDPELRLPQVVNLTLAIGIATSFPLLVMMMLSVANMDAVENSALPYAELFQQIMGSKVITTFIVSWITLVLFSALIGQWVTCGRLVWAFARDGGLPYSGYFAHVSKRYGFPVRTTALTLVFCCCYGLLYLISTTAFNSIITSAVLFSNITYCIPQAIVVIRGRNNVLPDHGFDLGIFGRLCNLSSPLFALFLGVIICFPPELPVTTQNANYTPAIFAGCYLTILGGWFVAGERFEGPKIDWEVLKNIKVT